MSRLFSQMSDWWFGNACETSDKNISAKGSQEHETDVAGDTNNSIT